jgi:N6-L-threonylcarbamoyladenine synthase
MNILGIETSCDETAAALVQNGKILSNIVHSQSIHQSSGGVIPEIASREHELLLNQVVQQALDSAKLSTKDIGGIAVTQGPGLAGALLTGTCFAKGLSLGLNIPMIGINHLEAHIFANFLGQTSLTFPFVCLLVSGGHTQLWKLNSTDHYEMLGESRDDAAGEAFDKGARILGLGYPGGPEIENCARGGDPNAISFPRAFLGDKNLEFSFSGLKTSLLYYRKKMETKLEKEKLNDIAASYQAAIVDVLITKLKNALIETGIETCVIAGGVSANKSLRKIAKQRLIGINVIYPPLDLCTDNAAMVAFLGEKKIRAGEESAITFSVRPNYPLSD